MKHLDYYTGFEGEPDITFTSLVNNNAVEKILLWYGYFYTIMMTIEIAPNGYWNGLALPFHLHIGWYDEQNWEIPNLVEVIEQFENLILPTEDNLLGEIRMNLVQLFKESYHQSGKVIIDYS